MEIKKVDVFFLVIFSFVCGLVSHCQQLAFPSAQGFGAYSQGGRGGDVYIVKNLNDLGEGSLRHGIKSAQGPRTIIFAISGIIELKTPLLVNKNYLTIAGQSAPGDGICLKDAGLIIDANHVIIRFIRSRLGDNSGRKDDAISIVGGSNVIIDHCSASWSVDEVLSVSTSKKDEIDNITIQWCIISEALNNSIHDKKEHGYGALIRGCYGAKYSYHHNLFAHNASRNPRPGNYDINSHEVDTLGLLLDFKNNVIYNWKGSRPGYDADKKSKCNYNYVGNYVKPGPDSDKKSVAYDAKSPFFSAFYSDNFFFGKIPEDQWSFVRFKGLTEREKESYISLTEFESNVKTENPLTAYNNVLRLAGASLNRDDVDSRVVSDVINGTGKIIDDEVQVGGWPIYKTTITDSDVDKDGIPDSWELKHGLNPQDPLDGNMLCDGYTYLEKYLNEKANNY